MERMSERRSMGGKQLERGQGREDRLFCIKMRERVMTGVG